MKKVKPKVRWGALKPARASAGPAHVLQIEHHLLEGWALFVPVQLPRHLAELCSEERPIEVIDLPLVALGMRQAIRPRCTAWLMRKDGAPHLVLNGREVEEMIALVGLLDAERAVQLHEDQDGADWIEASEIEPDARRAAASALIFGRKR